MICPICKSRWAPISEKESTASYLERGKVFRSNEIRCCGSEDCLQAVNAMIHHNSFEPDPTLRTSYNDLVRETEKELAEGKIG